MRIKSMITMALVVVSGMSSAAIGQQPRRQPSPQERADRQMRWMDKNLGLTEEQRGKVYDILLYYARERTQANRNEAPGPAKQQDKRGLRHDENGELRSVLTGQQFAMYKEHLQQMKERRQEHSGNMPPPQQGGY